MQAYHLRPCLETDRDVVADVWHSSASLPGVGPPVMPSRDELRARVDEEFASGWSVTVAVRGNEVIGFVAVRPREAALDELFVRPDSIGGGVGRALLACAIKEMPAGFTLYTRSANARARRFYERGGLIFLREDVHPRTGDPIAYYGWNLR